MGLEENVKKFAEEARNILLLAIEENNIVRPGKAYWLGFTSGGNGLVRQDQKIKAVKVVGNASLPPNSIVYIDETNTVDIGFARSPIMPNKKKSEITPQRALIRRKRPLIEEIAREIIIGWILMYHSTRTLPSYMSQPIASIYINDFYNKVTSDSNTVSCSPAYKVSSGTTYRLSVVSAYCWTVSASSTFTTTATADGSCGGATASATAVSSGGLAYDFDGAYEVVQTSADTNGVASGTQELNRFGNVGDSDAKAVCQYITFPNAEIYYQLPNNESNQPVRRKVDLKNLVTYDIHGFNHIQNFSVKENGTLYVYSIFEIHEVDMSVDDQIYFSEDQYEKVERRGIGRVYQTCLHVRINMQTGAVESRKTTSGPFSNYYYEIYYEAGYTNGYSSASIFYKHLYSAFTGTAGGYEGQLDDPSPIWSNSFNGNWISAFSNIPYDATAQANLNGSEIRDFLECAWADNKWRSGFHSIAPSVNLAGGVNTSFSSTYNWDPVANPTTDNKWQDGLAYYDDYRDIENLPVVINVEANRASEYPEGDEFVRYTQVNIVSTRKGGPNYELALSYDSPAFNGDRLEINHMRVSYNVPSDQVGGNIDPYDPQP